jgi:hypothetical protein
MHVCMVVVYIPSLNCIENELKHVHVWMIVVMITSMFVSENSLVMSSNVMYESMGYYYLAAMIGYQWPMDGYLVLNVRVYETRHTIHVVDAVLYHLYFYHYGMRNGTSLVLVELVHYVDLMFLMSI